jgi:hypothetical protein
MTAPDVYVAKESATFDWKGQPVFLTAGVTTVRAGHPILSGHAHLFEPLRIHFDVPRPEPAEDSESAPANQIRADHRGARTRAVPRPAD